jgi:hypothetical protein
MMVFEEAGKTILQPLITGQDAHSVQKLFENGTLEVWLPNGKFDHAQFDVPSSSTCSKCRVRKNVV